MSQEKTVDFNLKEIVRDHMDKEVHEPTRLEVTPSNIKDMTDQQLYDISPKLEIGELLLRMFATSIKAKDIEETGDLYTFIKKVRNKMLTDKGIWKLTQEDLDKLNKYVKKVEGPLRSPMMAGFIQLRFKDLELKLHELEKKP